MSRIYVIGLMGEFTEETHIKNLTGCLAHGKHSADCSTTATALFTKNHYYMSFQSFKINICVYIYIYVVVVVVV